MKTVNSQHKGDCVNLGVLVAEKELAETALEWRELSGAHYDPNITLLALKIF